jgi:hypothetical protein
VTRGVQKRHKKKSRENLLSFQKKHSLTYIAFFYFFSRRPLGVNKNDESDVYLPQPQNKTNRQIAPKQESSYLLTSFYFYFYFFIDFFYRVFMSFVTRGGGGGVKKRYNFFSQKPIWAHHSSHKMWFFFLCFFPPLPLKLFCSIFFTRVFGRFVTRGVQKRDLKNRPKQSREIFRCRQ